MLKIRLARVGKKKAPTYRVVVADARKPRDGGYVEILGHYNPRTEPTTFVIDGDKVKDWLSKGAQPTDRISKLLAKEGLVPAKHWGPPPGSDGKPKGPTPPRAGATPAAAPAAAAAPVAAPSAAAAPEADAEAPAEAIDATDAVTDEASIEPEAEETAEGVEADVEASVEEEEKA
jgi:small subunit ribosomal protein S16